MRFFVFLFLVTVRLRAQEQDTDTNELATRLQSEVAELRGISFRRPCKVGVYTRAQLREVVQELTAMELDKPAVKAQFEAFRLLGLLNADFDAKKGVEQLLASQIAGFYDPEKKELFLIREEPGARSKALDLVGMSGDVVVAHELTHALQDQHYDLVKLLESSDNWDVTQALHTLIEGDATVVMTLIDKAGPLLALNYRIAPSSVAGLRPLLKLAEAQGGEAAKEARLLRTTPAVLLDPMLFDYHEGYRFVRKLVKNTDDGEWDFSRVDAAFRSPPLSTEQILHPKKYRGDEPDWPTQLELPDLCETLGPTYMRAGGNTLGEMLIRTLLGRYKVRGRRRKHRGWDGDRIEIYRSKNDGAALLWMSVWDSAKDAREFGEGLRSIQTSRWPDLEFRSKGKQEIWAQDDNKVFGHYRQDDIVIAFQNWPQERLQASLKRLLSETQRIERKPLLPPR